MPQQKQTLGDFELTILSDGTYFLDGGSMFGVVPKSLWSKKAQVNERNQMDCGLNSVLVRSGDKNVLIETGIGNKLSDKLKAIYEPQELLMKSFEAAGVSPDEIDIVINSHLHFDHCGWNTIYKGGKAVPTFPNAKYYAQRGEWEHGRKQLERDKISYMSDNYDPLIESGQMQLLTGDAQIIPGVSVALYPGHTRNMQAVMIESGGKTACYISDLIPTAAHIDLTWVMSYDLFPLETIESRKRYYSRAIPEQWLTIFTHDHTTPWAYLESPKPGKITVRELPMS
ncbi:MAG: beta-lactamase-like protein [Candidatus Angelobacter sp.]|jgi:glyoxylase-like metal-dependent hydrolase (beta-lactamase superfamily II)|nr:beta-lactamase-like protein [Candidatus Angelobacter sp.]